MARNNYEKTGLLTTTQYAKLTGISPATALRAVITGKIKAKQTPGGHFRIPMANVSTNQWWNYKPSKEQLKLGRQQLRRKLYRLEKKG